MPLPLTLSCFSKIQIGFTFPVASHPRSPGKRAIKWLCLCVPENAFDNCLHTRSSATADGPHDALCESKTQDLVNCWYKLYNEFNTNQIKTCSKQPQLADCHTGVVNKLNHWQWSRSFVNSAIDLLWRNFLYRVRSLGQSSRGMYPNFWRYPNFLITHYGTGRMPKISSIRPVVSIQYWRVMDRWTHDDSKYLLA